MDVRQHGTHGSGKSAEVKRFQGGRAESKLVLRLLHRRIRLRRDLFLCTPLKSKKYEPMSHIPENKDEPSKEKVTFHVSHKMWLVNMC